MTTFDWVLETLQTSLDATQRCVLLECRPFLIDEVARLVCEYVCLDSRVAEYASLIHRSTARFTDKKGQVWEIAVYGDETTIRECTTEHIGPFSTDRMYFKRNHKCACVSLNPYTLMIKQSTSIFGTARTMDWITIWRIVFERDSYISERFAISMCGERAGLWDEYVEMSELVDGLVDALRAEIFKEMREHNVPPKLCEHDSCGFQCEAYAAR